MKSLSECIRKYPELKLIPHSVCQECELRKEYTNNHCVYGNDRLKELGYDL